MKTHKSQRSLNSLPEIWQGFRFILPATLLVLLVLAAAPTVWAGSYNWDPGHTPTTGSDGSGTWDTTTANWTNNSIDVVWPNSVSGVDTAVFGTNSANALTAGYTVTLASPGVNAGNLTFNYNNGVNVYKITGQTLTFKGTPTINCAGTSAQAVQISSLLAGVGFTKIGSGLVKFDGNSSSYSGTIAINAGTVQIGNNASSGNLGGGTITLTNAGVFAVRLSGATMTLNNTVGGTSSAPFGVSFQLNGSSVVTVGKANTYVAATQLTPTAAGTVGTLKLGVANGLPTNTDFTITANGASSQIFDLGGYNQALASLTSTGSITTTIVTSSSASPTLTIFGTNSTSFAGLLSGSLALYKDNINTLTLTGVSTYTGNTTINGGTLALGASASLNNTPQIIINVGGTLDVSSNSAYALGASTLTSSGTATPATINGNPTGTVSLGSQTITLNYDGANPALTVSNAQLVLNGNTFTVNKATPLTSGDYVIITNVNNTVSSNGTFTVGGTAISGSIASLKIIGGQVILHLMPAAADSTKSHVTVSPGSLPADNVATATVTATIKDSANNPIVGVSVNWTVTGSGNTVTPLAFGNTDGSGQTTFTIKSVKPETKTVTVTVGLVTITNSLVINFTNPSAPLVFTWDPTHSTSGSDGGGTWDTSTANWANNGVDVPWPNNGNDQAVIATGGSGSGTITLGSPITVGNLTFPNTTQYTISGANTLTFSNSPTIDVFNGVLIQAPVAGTGFTKTDIGTLRFDCNSPGYTGNMIVSNGLLMIGNNDAATVVNSGTGTITLADPGSLVVRRSGSTLTLSNTVVGTSTASVGFQLGGIVILASANTYTAAGTYLQPNSANGVGTLRLGINNGLPTNTDFTINTNGASRQTFDLAGFNQTLSSLANGANGDPTNSIVTNSVSTTTSTLTLSGAGKTTTFGGQIAGKVNLALGGSGSTLTVQQTNSLSAFSIVTITNGAALDLAFTGTNQIAGLVINSASKVPGVYSAASDSPSLAGTGYLLVVPVATINPNPPVLQVSVSASTMSLAWPTNLGWILQSNSVGLTTTGAWNNYPADGSVTVTNVNISVDPTKTNVFYRMLKP